MVNPRANLAVVLLLGVTLMAAWWLGSRRDGHRWRTGEPLVQPEPVWEMDAAAGVTTSVTPGGLILVREAERLRALDSQGRGLFETSLPADNLVLPLPAAEPAMALLIFDVVPVLTGEHPYGESLRIRIGLEGRVQSYDLPGGALLSVATVDGQRMVLGVMSLDGDRPEGRLHVLDGGRQTAVHRLAAGIVSRLELCAAGEYVVAADSKTVHYLDLESGRLIGDWRYPEGVRDVSLLPGGGPIVLTATALQVYDQQGRLAWRRPLRSPGVALEAGSKLIMVATRDQLEAYLEDGERVGRWVPRGLIRDIDLTAEGANLLVVYEDWRMAMYRIIDPPTSAAASRLGVGP
ncbi:MAG TPA: hypothetical protein DEQ28_07610 [Clostridiales bacterium]|nr:hypothetical protein [Clostridiales bacterium]